MTPCFVVDFVEVEVESVVVIERMVSVGSLVAGTVEVSDKEAVEQVTVPIVDTSENVVAD